MQEGRYKVLMYVFLGLFVISAGIGGYFGLFYYNYKKLLKSYNTNITQSQNVVENVMNNSRMGVIKSISENELVITNDQQTETTFKISDKTLVQKLQESKDDPGTFLYETAQKSDLIVGQNVWIITNIKDNSVADNIKISD